MIIEHILGTPVQENLLDVAAIAEPEMEDRRRTLGLDLEDGASMMMRTTSFMDMLYVEEMAMISAMVAYAAKYPTETIAFFDEHPNQRFMLYPIYLAIKMVVGQAIPPSNKIEEDVATDLADTIRAIQAGRTSVDTFTCAQCGGTFEKDEEWTDEQKTAELAKDFGPNAKVEGCVSVCNECYDALKRELSN